MFFHVILKDINLYNKCISEILLIINNSREFMGLLENSVDSYFLTVYCLGLNAVSSKHLIILVFTYKEKLVS